MPYLSQTTQINCKGLKLQVRFAAGEKGIKAVTLHPARTEGVAWHLEAPKPMPALEALIGRWMAAYVKKRQPDVVLPVDLAGLTPYALRVLSVLKEIPFGASLTYQSLAEKAGVPKGARATGSACGRNPCLLIIPCHRVVGKQGLGGFAAGLELKKALLQFETTSS